MEFSDNKDLMKFFRSLLNSETFMENANRVTGEQFLECYLAYVVATRSVPNDKLLEQMKSANIQDMVDITAEAITQELSKQIKQKGKYFTPTNSSVYARFCENVYKNGILFSGRKVHNKCHIDFPLHFKKLAVMQPDNPIIKGYMYQQNHGKDMVFALSPAQAFYGANTNLFWNNMLSGSVENDVDKNLKKLHQAVGSLMISGDEKSALFSKIAENFKDYFASNDIDISMIDCKDTYELKVYDCDGRQTNLNFGNGIPCRDYDEFVKANLPYFDNGIRVNEKDFRSPNEVIKSALFDYLMNTSLMNESVIVSRDYFNKHGRSVVIEKPNVNLTKHNEFDR